MKKAVAGLVLICVAGFLAWPKVSPLLSGESADVAGNSARNRAPAVKTVRLETAPFESKLTFNGTLIADSSIDIKSELRGKIDKIAFTDGQKVEEGDLIVSIESGELAAELSSVREQLTLAETNAERLKNLFSSGSVTASERDDAVSRREVLKAEERRLAVRLEKTQLLAPFAGTLGLREVSLGDLIEADTLITTLQTVEDLKVDFSVPERYQALLEPGLPVSLWVTGYDQPFTANVRAISPRVDINTRTIMVRADVANGERKLLPGNYARVELISRDDAALLVPSVAVLQSLEAVSVFTVQDGVAVRTEVKTGVRSDSQVQILQGLQAGDEVITQGIQSVRDGQRVEIRNSEGVG
ncbi:MAG: efflux RND transporter periplasmic adaptor subunit [Chromatocurvus sp.]